jgi:Tol biopolymer transport system component
MRDLRTLLDRAAGNPPDLPDLAAIRERGQAMKNRNRIRWATGVAVAVVLTAAGVGVAVQQSDRDAMPAPLPAQSATQETVTNACAVQPALPRDAIAYTDTSTSPSAAIHLMAPDGSDDRCLVDTPGPDTWPRWSPDGQWISFIGGDGTQEDIFIVRADGSGLTRVTDSPAREKQPVWSPDGTRLGYTASLGEEGAPSIHVVQRDGTRDATLPAGAAWVGLQDWSPDGTTLLYARDDSSGGHIALWTMSPDGSEQRLLRSEDGDFGSGARYSPDGTQIALQADLDGGCLYLSDATGGRLRRLTSGCQSGKTLTWAPDQTRILTAPGGDTPGDAEVVDLPEGNQHTITTDGNVTYVDWQPPTAR